MMFNYFLKIDVNTQNGSSHGDGRAQIEMALLRAAGGRPTQLSNFSDAVKKTWLAPTIKIEMFSQIQADAWGSIEMIAWMLETVINIGSTKGSSPKGNFKTSPRTQYPRWIDVSNPRNTQCMSAVGRLAPP